MKCILAIGIFALLLTGCTFVEEPIDEILELRKSVMESESCSFQSTIYADYGELSYKFQLDCTTDNDGKMHFTVIHPESISGITGMISEEDASLTFDDKVLAIPMLADNQIVPIAAPWVFLKTMKSGYIHGCSKTDDGLLVILDDSFENCPLRVELHLDTTNVPVLADIYWNQYCIMSVMIENFETV